MSTSAQSPIRLQLEIVIPTEAIAQIAKLLTPPLTPEQLGKQRSRHAHLPGQKPPVDVSLLVNSREVAKLLRVSDRTIFKMHSTGEMPKPLRFGTLTRWGKAEIAAWVDAGAPPTNEWKWPRE